MNNHCSVREAADVLSVSIQQVRNLIWNKQLEGRKIDRRWQISRRSIALRLQQLGERNGHGRNHNNHKP